MREQIPGSEQPAVPQSYIPCLYNYTATERFTFIVTLLRMG